MTPRFSDFFPNPPWKGPPLPKGLGLGWGRPQELSELFAGVEPEIGSVVNLDIPVLTHKLRTEEGGDEVSSIFEKIVKRAYWGEYLVAAAGPPEVIIISPGIPAFQEVPEIVGWMSVSTENYDILEFRTDLTSISENLQRKGPGGVYDFDTDGFGYVWMVARGLHHLSLDLRNNFMEKVFGKEATTVLTQTVWEDYWERKVR